MKTDAWTDERQMKALTMAIQSMKAIESIKAEMKSCIGTYYMIGEREYRDGTRFIECGHYDTGTIKQMIRIIDKHIGRGEDNVEQ